MRICDLNTALGKMSHAFAKLKERWATAKLHWNDDTNKQFEKNLLRDIPPKLQQLVSSAQRLADLLAQAERDCEDRPENT